ncbi:MAG: hypothetical protein M0027_03895 [Candidatus Dormibacteraeota bacterium]|jgi:hypothetical protein|nr:hypothetical protein [Candidatus Dormibacteraeota bacterium]
MNTGNDLAKVSVSSAGARQEYSLPWETTVADLQRLAGERFGAEAATGAELWCTDGTSMATKLERTLGELKDRLICPRREFELRPHRPRR